MCAEIARHDIIRLWCIEQQLSWGRPAEPMSPTLSSSSLSDAPNSSPPQAPQQRRGGSPLFEPRATLVQHSMGDLTLIPTAATIQPRGTIAANRSALMATGFTSDLSASRAPRGALRPNVAAAGKRRNTAIVQSSDSEQTPPRHLYRRSSGEVAPPAPAHVQQTLPSLLMAIEQRDILERQGAHGWGTKVVDRLAADLKSEFPDARGFSRANSKLLSATSSIACSLRWSPRNPSAPHPPSSTILVLLVSSKR